MNFPTISRYSWIGYSLLLVFLAFGSIPGAQAQENRKESITIEVKNQPIQRVFDEISKQTGLKFFYDQTVVEKGLYVDLKFRDAPVQTVLNELTRQANLFFKRENNTIAVGLNKPSAEAIPDGRPRKVTGLVTDAEGEPVIGANVLVKGTASGTVTDLNGAYSIEADGESVLLVSYIGYLSEEVVVGNRGRILIRLREDTRKLDEVVVIGYGTRKRSNLSGAISRVTADAIESKPIINVLSALQGEIPGMVIQRTSGQPGNEEFNMNVRGASSTNGGNSPLVLVDGIPGDINLINSEDIEAISVLKDASASIYGARAAGGVILITTKHGKKGVPTITYHGNLAISRMTGIMKIPTNYEMAVMDNEANIHNGSAPMYTPGLLEKIRRSDPNPIDHPLYGGWKLFFTDTDWMHELLEPGVQHKHNLTLSGGGERSDYYLSAGYSKQFGVVKYADDNNTKYNLRMNYNYEIAPWLRLETKVSLDNQKRTDIGGVGAWVIGEAIFDMPNHPVYNADGNFFTQGGWSNAVAMAREGETSTFNTREMNGNFRLIANLAEGLVFNAQVGINYKNRNDEDIAKATPLYTWDNDIAYYAIAGSPAESAVERLAEETLYQNYTGYLQYGKTLRANHHLDVMAGLAYETEEKKMFKARRDNFLTDKLWSLNLGGTSNMSNDAAGQHWATGSVFGRIGYNFRNKYILETNFRYDGSSRFAPDNRWRMFPGVSASWRISQENFLKKSPVFNELKLRASYGQTGNQEGIRLYDYIQLLKLRQDEWGGKIVYPFGDGSQTQSINLDVLAGVDRGWEILENMNVGLDAAFLDSRLDVSFDYFVKMNNNMLIPVTYPSMLGATPPESNSGKLRTNGFELTVHWADKIGNVEYSARFQLSDAVNKLVDYGGADTYELGLNKTREGYPIDSYFAYEYDGVIRNQQELDAYKKLEGVPSNIGIGDAKFKDINQDGKISTYGDKKGDDGDAVYVGSITPRFNFGLNLSARWKNFDVSLFFQGVGKRTLFREGEFAMPWSDWWRYPPRFYYGQTWNEDRPGAYYPRLTHGEIRRWNYQASTLQKINAAYVRMKNVQIGYSLPKSLLEKAGIQRTRIYVSGQDLFEIHNVKGGWDPESDKAGFNYPFQRYYSFGVDLTF